MDKIIKKSKVIFNLEFTTSKLLSYLVVLESAILGYLLGSVEVVIIGLIVGASLSGVKNITESIIRYKTKLFGKKDSDDSNNDENEENNKKQIL